MNNQLARNILTELKMLMAKEKEPLTEEQDALSMAISALSEQKKCCWCVHADLGDGACKKCRNKSMWNVLWEVEND